MLDFEDAEFTSSDIGLATKRLRILSLGEVRLGLGWQNPPSLNCQPNRMYNIFKRIE